MQCAILSYVGCSALQYFSALYPKRHDFRVKKMRTKCVLTFSTNLAETFLILRRTERDVIKNV